ncbi:lipoprotein insertase outer membrane protein LolB [Litoribacillus peritrichatus]|uniref:Outer-membrane lipoprotein LolB n=1 Tax=Litoribacillus peritrichatus TaxID=718191 RepID=A0ABP7MI48_9GAMM
MTRLLSIVMIALLMLQGCSTLHDMPTQTEPLSTQTPSHWAQHLDAIQQLNDWKISGKVGVVTPKQSQTGYIDWQQQSAVFDINIRGTLGFGGLDLSGDQDWVTIKVDENNQRTLPTDIALERYLDWEFPINSLKFWIKGIPAPNQTVQSQQFNQHGLLSRLIQQGWDIRLLNYEKHNDVFLPHKIIARSNGYKVSLVLSDWAFQ